MTRCTSCGLPLSPTRTYTRCPRCGVALSTSADPGPAMVTAPPQQYEQAQAWGQPAQQGSSPNQETLHPQQDLWGQPAMPGQGGANQLWLPGQPSPQPAGAGWSQPPAQPRRSSKSVLGYSVSVAFIVASAIILIFVYVLATAQSSTPNSPTAGITNTKLSVGSPTVLPSPTAPAKPTATAYPAQQMIYNPQMASAVDTLHAIPTQLTTTFKVGHKIFVTFGLHPSGQNGAACLTWYLNTKVVTQYAFPVHSIDKAGFSYAIFGQPGSAYVNIYWASTTDCTDQALAQHVPFNVTS